MARLRWGLALRSLSGLAPWRLLLTLRLRCVAVGRMRGPCWEARVAAGLNISAPFAAAVRVVLGALRDDDGGVGALVLRGTSFLRH
jgi:hypothetical protein